MMMMMMLDVDVDDDDDVEGCWWVWFPGNGHYRRCRLEADWTCRPEVKNKGLKHTDTAIAYLREKFVEMKYRLYHIGTDHSVADIFTKALFIQKLKDMRSNLINMRYI